MNTRRIVEFVVKELDDAGRVLDVDATENFGVAYNEAKRIRQRGRTAVVTLSVQVWDEEQTLAEEFQEAVPCD